MSGDHFGSYGDPPSNSERATKRAIENLKGERNQIRQLESELADKDRQLAEARAEIERLKRCCNCEYANHKFEICEHPDNEPETFMDGVCELWSHNI